MANNLKINLNTSFIYFYQIKQNLHLEEMVELEFTAASLISTRRYLAVEFSNAITTIAKQSKIEKVFIVMKN